MTKLPHMLAYNWKIGEEDLVCFIHRYFKAYLYKNNNLKIIIKELYVHRRFE
jgi:hypothetical protein